MNRQSNQADSTRRVVKVQRFHALVLVLLTCITMIFIPLLAPTPSNVYAATHQQRVGAVYSLNVSLAVLSPQDCTTSDGVTYNCSLQLFSTPPPAGVTTITVSVAATVSVAVAIQNPVLSATQPVTAVSITSLPCPSTPIVVTFAGVSSGLGDQVLPTTTTWSCAAQPTPTPTPPPTPTPSPTSPPKSTPPPGSTPTTVTSPTAKSTSTPGAAATPVAGATPSPMPSTPAGTMTPTPTSPKSTPSTGPTVASTVNAQTPTPLAGANVSGNNTPPSPGAENDGGRLFTMAGIALALVAFLLYLFSAGQSSMSERVLSLVLPQALLRKIRGRP